MICAAQYKLVALVQRTREVPVEVYYCGVLHLFCKYSTTTGTDVVTVSLSSVFSYVSS